MGTIGQYIQQRSTEALLGNYFKAADLHELASQHLRESARLHQTGEHLQAEVQHSIARSYSEQACALTHAS
jgi:hypothetical protein